MITRSGRKTRQAFILIFTGKDDSQEGKRGAEEHAMAAEDDIDGLDVTNEDKELQGIFIDKVG